jgi:hypothetical protein
LKDEERQVVEMRIKKENEEVQKKERKERKLVEILQIKAREAVLKELE